ncbi:hypothetical protein [Arcobacter sp. F2176]|uniref:hypothetical protein n=1 Tax=Arcobacter sp. F2176 TaxID=2044511 RepID=UPI00100AD1F8|nr:hypothetical protein [Arcobacter sp. F2176]RXJ79488.1 hypothetical protein CRU95_14195 [Arcobacter sp. F2176]
MKKLLVLEFIVLVLFLNGCSSTTTNLSQEKVVQANIQEDKYDDFDRMDREDERLMSNNNGLLNLNTCPITR